MRLDNAKCRERQEIWQNAMISFSACALEVPLNIYKKKDIRNQKMG